MKKFEFRLETALRLRHMRAEAEKAKLQDLLAQRERLRKSLETMRHERTEAAGFVHSVANPLSRDLRALSSYMVSWESRSRILSESIKQVDCEIAEQNTRLRKAEQDKLCLTNLRKEAGGVDESGRSPVGNKCSRTLAVFTHY